METFSEHIEEYKDQLRNGHIKAVYKGLMEYIMGLRTYFNNKYPDYFVSGSVYQGYLDMSYFSFFPESLKARKLKIAVVFIHEEARFEAWLTGYNKQVQAKYWKLFKESGWSKYRIPSNLKGVDFILDHNLADNTDFGDLPGLTKRIEAGTLRFIKDIEGFLAQR
jgi:hypothetical protein